MKQCICAEHWI